MAGDIFAYIDGICLCGESFFLLLNPISGGRKEKNTGYDRPEDQRFLGSVIYFCRGREFVYREHLAQRKIAEVC